MYILFAGRHIITTAFQEEYCKKILTTPIKDLEMINKKSFPKGEKIEKIVFAITSMNQSNSRYNPIPYIYRFTGLDRFATNLKRAINIDTEIVGVPHYSNNKDFTRLIVKEVNANMYNHAPLTPKNTIVICSTQALIKLFVKDGYSVLPAEYDTISKEYKEDTPQNILESVIFNNSNLSKVSFASLSIFKDYPYVLEECINIYSDPLLTNSGSLTKDRNYSTYAQEMSSKEVIKYKYDEIKQFISNEGIIADEGCADGILLQLISQDNKDADLIGIEITSEFLARCHERVRAGEFGFSYVHFYQKNILFPIFKDNTIRTTICNSTAHELWSYGKGNETLHDYLQMKNKQLHKGGDLIIRDVVGPENGDQIVYAKFIKTDNQTQFKKSKQRKKLKELEAMSTAARFQQFVQDFVCINVSKKIHKYSIIHEDENVIVVEASMRLIHEFIMHKDYVDNWYSEVQESFGFWSIRDWKQALDGADFTMDKYSHAYTSEWIAENRFKNCVKIYDSKECKKQIPFPVTNMVIIAKKN